MLAYLLRVSLAPADTTIQRDLGLSSTRMGDVLGAFFLGYVWLQVPGAGWASKLARGWRWRRWRRSRRRRWSSRRRPTRSACFMGRGFLLGLAQAGLFAVTIMAIREWFPASRQGLPRR